MNDFIPLFGEIWPILNGAPDGQVLFQSEGIDHTMSDSDSGQYPLVRKKAGGPSARVACGAECPLQMVLKLAERGRRIDIRFSEERQLDQTVALPWLEAEGQLVAQTTEGDARDRIITLPDDSQALAEALA